MTTVSLEVGDPVGAPVVGDVVGVGVVGDVVGAAVVGPDAVGDAVVGDEVVGATVVGATVVGAAAVGGLGDAVVRSVIIIPVLAPEETKHTPSCIQLPSCTPKACAPSCDGPAPSSRLISHSAFVLPRLIQYLQRMRGS